MTYYAFEFDAGSVTAANGVAGETYVFRYPDAPQLVLKYLRVDQIWYEGLAVSGECGGGVAFQYFNAEPPITSVANQVSSSLASVFNGLRFNLDKYKPFELPEGLPLPTGKNFSLGLDWYGFPPAVAVTLRMSVTFGFEIPSGSKAQGEVIPPGLVFDKLIMPEKKLKGYHLQENPTREVSDRVS